MFIEILLAIMIGVIAGIITGLTPGIHINLVAITLLSLSAVLSKYFSLLSLSCFIISMSVTHSFLDSIPSIFLGAPDSATALGVLPGHRYLLKGFGLMAVKLTLIGSFGALVLSILLYPVLLPVVPFLYSLIEPYIGIILILIVIFMIFRDKKKLWAILVFLLSGTLGILVFSWHSLKNPLFPLLSGLFGISTLLISLKDKTIIPEQKIQNKTDLKPLITVKALLSGQFSGFLTAILPGVGAATAAVISLQLTRKLGDNGFMILMGSINTVNFILSILTLQVLGKARNGSIIAVKELLTSINTEYVFIFLATVLVSGGIAAILTLKLGLLFSKYISKVNYKMLVMSIISMIILLTLVLTGFKGILILIISTFIGLIPAIVKVKRIHAMGCLLLPVIFYFIL